MVEIILDYTVKVRNLGVQHDIICGISLLDPSTEEELFRAPWWVIWDVPPGSAWTVGLQTPGDIPPATYTAVCRVWTGFIPGIKIKDLIKADGTVVGIAYEASWEDLLEPPILDEATKTFIVTPTGGVVQEIEQFTVTIV